ncbi:hypothetical protein [Nocardia sp. NPDC050710]|uniref:hypothetical protein n=1 Tax=Nocardia sp. NPDC050710 TaxID=3157220 RepID=UPI0033E8B42E
MNPTDPPDARHQFAAGTTSHAEAVASILSATYAPGDQVASVQPQYAGIDTIDVDVRRRDIFRFVIDVAAADAVRVAELLATLAPQPPADCHDWVALGRQAFHAGLVHPSPLANPAVAPHITGPSADPDVVAEITAQYRRAGTKPPKSKPRRRFPTPTPHPTSRHHPASPSTSCATTSTRWPRSYSTAAPPLLGARTKF